MGGWTRLRRVYYPYGRQVSIEVRTGRVRTEEQRSERLHTMALRVVTDILSSHTFVQIVAIAIHNRI